jgi:hypothetical protein
MVAFASGLPTARGRRSRTQVPERIKLALGVYALSVVGVFLLAVPWTTLWDAATSGFAPTAGGAWIRSGWVRGAVSGLGVLDLAAAAGEAAGLWRLLRPSRGLSP